MFIFSFSMWLPLPLYFLSATFSRLMNKIILSHTHMKALPVCPNAWFLYHVIFQVGTLSMMQNVVNAERVFSQHPKRGYMWLLYIERKGRSSVTKMAASMLQLIHPLSDNTA